MLVGLSLWRSGLWEIGDEQAGVYRLVFNMASLLGVISEISSWTCIAGLGGGMGASLIGSSKCMGEKSAADAKWEGPGPRRADPGAALVAERLRPAKDVSLAIRLTWGVAVS